MRRLLLLITTLAVGMVLAGGLAWGSGEEPSVAQAKPQGHSVDARKLRKLREFPCGPSKAAPRHCRGRKR